MNTMPRINSLPSLALMRSFEAAARHESYTMAAEELGVTQSAISRQVRELEAAIGVTLFRRVGRAVRLSKAGRALRDELAGDLERLSGTINRAIAAGDGASLLTLAVLPTFATRWLVPRLPDFKTRHPGIELDLHSYTTPFSLEERRMDLAIHFGQEDWPGAQLRRLFPEHLVVTAAPALLRRHRLDTRAQTFELPLLHLTSRPELWSTYHSQLGLDPGAVFPGMRFDQFSMLIEAAVVGLGAAILPSYLIEEELASGVLTEIGQIANTSNSAYYIATPTGQKNDAVQVFANWIGKQTRARG
ncbi:LysR family transcriptional regulator [Ruegeria marisrubri]|uniref:LysR family transcriptional regulator n=1 Tax=Ruegeria marisrubri TaxID=1685379 RepID=UPI001CD316AE|nr:LysR family transcriptional regulator [Ruegeria marisrubri]MCA0907072.1 LysR family transcriptional regulator [Ruegeria marisrubri]